MISRLIQYLEVRIKPDNHNVTYWILYFSEFIFKYRYCLLLVERGRYNSHANIFHFDLLQVFLKALTTHFSFTTYDMKLDVSCQTDDHRGQKLTRVIKTDESSKYLSSQKISNATWRFLKFKMVDSICLREVEKKACRNNNSQRIWSFFVQGQGGLLKMANHGKQKNSLVTESFENPLIHFNFCVRGFMRLLMTYQRQICKTEDGGRFFENHIRINRFVCIFYHLYIKLAIDKLISK